MVPVLLKRSVKIELHRSALGRTRMNIFFLSRKTRRCARWHCDKHVVKMILESTQMLYTAHHENGGTPMIEAKAPPCSSTGRRGYKSHAKNHPCTKWVKESLAHYKWLLALAFDLVREHTFRFSPKSIHACNTHLLWLKANHPPLLRMRRWLRDPPLAMPEEFHTSDSIISYIAYYNGPKRAKGLLVYTKRHIPHVFKVLDMGA